MKRKHSDPLTLRRNISPNVAVEMWNEVLADSIRQTLYREPNLRDFSLFHKEKRYGRSTFEIYHNRISLGIVVKIEGKLKFIKNDRRI